MGRLIILLFVILFLPVGYPAAQKSNPLLPMIGKQYGEYFDRYESLNDSLFSADSLFRSRLVGFHREAAAADPTGEWEMNRLLTECQVRFYESRKGGYIPRGNYSTDDLAADLLAVAREAQKKGFTFIRLRALFKLADGRIGRLPVAIAAARLLLPAHAAGLPRVGAPQPAMGGHP